MPADLWERLHGTVRYLDSMTTVPGPTGEATEAPDVPWWDPGSDASVDPERDAVVVGDVEVRRGTRVILRPGVRRADAYDLFLAGRSATVAAVLFDVDHGEHLAVTVDEDPGADLKAAHGRYLYFAPDEVEPLGRWRRADRGEAAMTRRAGRLRRQHLQGRRRVRRRGRGRPAPGATCPTGSGSSTSGSAACTWSTSCSRGYDVLVLVDTVAQQEGPPGIALRDRARRPARVVRRRTRCPR